jgi:membrane fusion protein, multidrug efflux system
MDDEPLAPLAPTLPERGYPAAEMRRVAPQPDGETPALHEPDEPRSGRRSGLWLLLALLVIAGLATWLIVRHGHQAGPTQRFTTSGPMPVGTAKVTQGNMPVELSALGTVTPLATVTVKTQINGQLTEVAFSEGQMVKKGQFLAQIDPRPYQVALEQAEAQLAKDRATLDNAELDLRRYRTLLAQNSIAKMTVDTQVATVEQDKATINADQAQIDAQKLNLTYAHIVAPVSGRVGLRQVDPGNYVQTSDPNGIVVITQLQPISVIFTLPEDSLPEVLQPLHADAKLPVVAYDRTGTRKLDSGMLETVDNQIDPTTGTVKLRAVFNNPDMILFPNQFVNVRLLVNTLTNIDLVPTAAIQRGAPGTFVYVVKPDHTVAAQPVTLGPSDNLHVAVMKGVQPGELVVTDGADRLKDGAKVSLAEAATPGGSVAPMRNGAHGKGGARRTNSPAATASPGASSPRAGMGAGLTR